MSGTAYDAKLNAYAEFRAAFQPYNLALLNRRELVEKIRAATERLDAALVSIGVDAGERSAVPPCRFKVGDVVKLRNGHNCRGYVDSVFYDRLANKPRWRLRVEKSQLSNPVATWDADQCDLVTYPDTKV